MKRIFLSAILVLGAWSTRVQAQVPVPAMPNMFSTMAACKEALATGRLRFYEPKYFGLRTVNPTNDRDRIIVPLESDTCLEMLVVGGRRFVAQREGTLFRAQKRGDGSLAVYARNDCGNPVYGVVYSPPPPPEPVPEQPRERIALSAAPLRLNPPPSVNPALVLHETTPVSQEKKHGFCSSKKCRWALVVIGASAGGYAAYRYWPCPPGTVRR